jgi:hypothetical protein
VDPKKLMVMGAISIGGFIAMTCIDMGAGRISGSWKGDCHGAAVSLEAKDGRVNLSRGKQHWEGPFVPGEDNVAKFGKSEVHFHVDGLTHDLDLSFPEAEPCYLKRI